MLHSTEIQQENEILALEVTLVLVALLIEMYMIQDHACSEYHVPIYNIIYCNRQFTLKISHTQKAMKFLHATKDLSRFEYQFHMKSRYISLVVKI